ncbi:MAG: FAD-dependent oxidoreductase [Anaerolineae bacterium]|jgi:NADPH-dependent 2,4-dienoyl-CoA reductase/sulfur reductase-like enzyme
MSGRRRLVVIGGDAAGMSAASQARRRDRDLEIIVLERGEYLSYAACGMPYLVGGQVPDPARLIARTAEQFRQQGIQVHLQHTVEAIDAGEQSLSVRTAKGEQLTQHYDELLIATGARDVRPELSGADAAGVFSLRGLGSGIALWDYVRNQRPQRAVVVGGGYIGLEIADALRRREIDTTLVDLLPEVMATLDPEMGALASGALRAMGVSLRLNARVEALDVADGRVACVRLGEAVLPADLVVFGIGARPNSELAGAAGIPLGVRGAIRVDRQLRTGLPHIWAAGDCAESLHRVTGRPTWQALGTVANKMGRIAGLNITGARAEFPGVVGTAITLVGETEIARTGLSEQESVALQLDPVAATIQDRTRAGYYPGAAPITVKLIARRQGGRLLGAQIVGGAGAGKRIDTIATCLTAGLSVEDLLQLDLAYAPPFSPVWDPVQTAARVLLGSVVNSQSRSDALESAND